MKSIFLLIVASLAPALSASAQTPGVPRFPDGLDSRCTQLEMKNNATTTLSVTLTASATAAVVASTAKFPACGAIAVGSEVIYYSSKTDTIFQGLLRAQEGTTAAQHLASAAVKGAIVSGQHNVQADLITRLEEKVGVTASQPAANTVLFGYGAGTSQWRDTITIAALNTTGNASVGGNLTVGGTISGNGSAITGVQAAGAGAGSTSPGALSFIANNDGAAGDGAIDFMSGSPPVSRAKINPDNSFDVNGPLGLLRTTLVGLPVPCQARQLADVTDGPRGLHRCKADGSGWRSVLGFVHASDFDARGDESANDTAALQAALNAANAANMDMYIPAGTYMTNTLQWPARVSVWGGGMGFTSAMAARQVTTLRSRAAEPLFQSDNLSNLIGGPGKISDITFDGAGLGTIGLDLAGLERFKIERVNVTGFTQYGAKFRALSMGRIEDSTFRLNATGLHMTDGSTNLGNMPANHIVIDTCYINENTKWAVDWSRGSSLRIVNSDMELNGTNGDSDSGVIKVRDWGGNDAEGLGLSVDGLWLERNKGFALFDIGFPVSANARNSLSRVIDVQVAGETQQLYGVYLRTATLSNFHWTFVNDSALRGSQTADIFEESVNSVVRLTNTIYDTRSVAAGAGFSTAASQPDGNIVTTQYFHDTAAPNTKNSIQAIPAGGGVSFHFGTNLETVGSTVNRFDTALGAWRATFSMSPQTYTISYCAAGANPCTPTTLFTLSNAGNVTAPGTLTVGGGSTAQQFRTASVSFNFAQLGANACETLTGTLTGVDNDAAWAVTATAVNALATHNTTSMFYAWASALNTVSLRRCVISADGSDPAAGSVRLSAWK